MKGFFGLFSVFFKARIFSRSFKAIAAVMLILAGGFSLLCPDPSPSSASVGLIYDHSDPLLSQNMQQLLELEELRFIRYIEEEQMCRDIMSGKLHCGYSVDINSQTPIAVFETDASFLTPAIDELVFSSWFETVMLQKAPRLYGEGKHAELISESISRSRLQNKPFTVEIKVNAASSGGEYAGYSLLPVVYAVMIPLLLLGSCFCAMLAPGGERDTLSLLSGSDCVKGRTLLARFASHAVLFFILSVICDAVICISVGQNSFSLPSRLICAVLISLTSAVLFELFSKIKSNSAVILLIMILSALSIIFSGAFVSPELFGGLEPLKYISPSWLLLRLMTAVTAL